MKQLSLSLITALFFITAGILNGQECAPQFFETYSFPVGSVFQYKTTSGGEYATKDVRIERYTVTGIWERGDSLFISREGDFESSTYLLGFDRVIDSRESGIINDTIFEVNEPERMINSCEDQLVQINPDLNLYSFVKVENSEKIIGGQNNIFELDEKNDLVSIDLEKSFNYHYLNVFRKGAGLHKYSEGDIMTFTKKECEGYIIDGDSTGVFKNLALSVPQTLYDNSLVVFPSILEEDGRVNINSKDRIESLQIVSLDGKIMKQDQLYQDHIIFDGISRGMYFLTLIFDDHRETRKIIKR